jgi:hypothetical protein
MVIYGVNASGKSSFVDAVEYVLNDAKITHLAHEYSGKRQEKAVPNTHKPQGRKTELKIKLENGNEVKTEISEDGSSTSSGAESVGMDSWDYRRTVLRQDEVAAFIHDTKGRKYSALLPLLGLHQMEVAAENLRQLAKSVEEQSKLKEAKVILREVEAKRKATFGTESDDQIFTKIQQLHVRYCADNAAAGRTLSRCEELKAALDTRISGSSFEQRRHMMLQGVAALDLKSGVEAVRIGSGMLAGAVEPLIAEKLEILQSTGAFVDKLGDEQEVKCPACGRFISVDAFQDHVQAERDRLHELITTFNARRAAIGALCDTVKSLKSVLANGDLKSWRDDLAKGSLADKVVHLDSIDTEALRTSCAENDLKTIESKLLPLIDAAASAAKGAPPDVQELSTDRQRVEACIAVIAATEQVAEVGRAEALVSFINSLEQGIREEIKLRSQAVIGDISTDIQAMWAILHPGEAIEHIRSWTLALRSSRRATRRSSTRCARLSMRSSTRPSRSALESPSNW